MNKLMCAGLAACSVVAAAHATQPDPFDFGRDFNPMLYPKDSRPFDKSIFGWGDASVQWIYAQPFDQNPFFDATGANCGVAQHGPVWFLAPIASMAAGSFTRACTIPRGKAILLVAQFVSDTYPCPDPAFTPPAGMSLYDFLVADSETYLMTKKLDITLDGRPVRNALDYHYVSENVFSLKGDPSLQAPFDPCINTAWQPVVANGWYFMFRPLSPGMHTIVRKTTSTMGTTNTFTYYLTIK